MNVSLPGHEPLQIHPGRYYLKSLSCDPTESVDEEAYLHEVEREARVFFCHLHFNIMHELDTVDTNLTLHIFQMSTDECKRIDPAYFSLSCFSSTIGNMLWIFIQKNSVVQFYLWLPLFIFQGLSESLKRTKKLL